MLEGHSSEHAGLDAATLAGLLADPDRRRLVAALILGARDLQAVVDATKLDTVRAGRALARLEGAGLVEREPEGKLVLLDGSFAMAARAAGAARHARAVDAPPQTDADMVLARFVRDGRLVSIPTNQSKRIVVLAHVAQEFEPGRRYSESMVNLILGRWYPDTAILRRYLVDEGLLDRALGEYWRSGGPVPV